MNVPAPATPDHFYVVHLDLAREPGHPEGSLEDRYTLLLPLTADGSILKAEARAHPDFCRVSRAYAQDEVKRGLIVHESDGTWVFDFGDAEREPEVAFRFSKERFIPGEYVSIQRGDDQHTYRVVSLQPL